MIWQSWGHSAAAHGAAPGELDLQRRHRGTLPGPAGHGLVRATTSRTAGRPRGPEFTYFRDWVAYTGIATPGLRHERRPSRPGRRTTLYLSGSRRARHGAVGGHGRQRHLRQPGGGGPASYSEISGLEGAGEPRPSGVTPPSTHPAPSPPGPPRCPTPVGVVGSPTLTLHLSSRSPRRQSRRPAGAAAAVRQDLRRRSGRHQDAGQPADLARGSPT